jgi:hypothetical protein
MNGVRVLSFWIWPNTDGPLQARGLGCFALYTMRCRASLGIMRRWSLH